MSEICSWRTYKKAFHPSVWNPRCNVDAALKASGYVVSAILGAAKDSYHYGAVERYVKREREGESLQVVYSLARNKHGKRVIRVYTREILG